MRTTHSRSLISTFTVRLSLSTIAKVAAFEILIKILTSHCSRADRFELCLEKCLEDRISRDMPILCTIAHISYVRILLHETRMCNKSRLIFTDRRMFRQTDARWENI